MRFLAISSCPARHVVLVPGCHDRGERVAGGPKHRQIADDLRGQVNRGELAPGAQLPSEAELRQEYGASRTTVRAATPPRRLVQQHGPIHLLHPPRIPLRSLAPLFPSGLGCPVPAAHRDTTEPRTSPRRAAAHQHLSAIPQVLAMAGHQQHTCGAHRAASLECLTRRRQPGYPSSARRPDNMAAPMRACQRTTFADTPARASSNAWSLCLRYTV